MTPRAAATLLTLIALILTPAAAAYDYPHFSPEPYDHSPIRIHPVTASISPNETVRNYYLRTLDDAMTWWANGGNGQLEFPVHWAIEPNASRADIIVTWTRDLPPRADGSNPAGYARFSVNDTTGRYDTPVHVVLEMGERPAGGPPESWRQYNHEALTTIAAHELGHALGLAHSNDPDDVMHPTGDYVGNRFARSPQDLQHAADRVPLVLGAVAALLLPALLVPLILRKHLWRRDDLTLDDDER